MLIILLSLFSIILTLYFKFQTAITPSLYKIVHMFI